MYRFFQHTRGVLDSFKLLGIKKTNIYKPCKIYTIVCIYLSASHHPMLVHFVQFFLLYRFLALDVLLFKHTTAAIPTVCHGSLWWQLLPETPRVWLQQIWFRHIEKDWRVVSPSWRSQGRHSMSSAGWAGWRNFCFTPAFSRGLLLKIRCIKFSLWFNWPILLIFS